MISNLDLYTAPPPSSWDRYDGEEDAPVMAAMRADVVLEAGDLDGYDGHRLSVAKKTIEQFVARAIRLYEQEPGEACASSRFGVYVRRWAGWARAGLPVVRNAPIMLCTDPQWNVVPHLLIANVTWFSSNYRSKQYNR